MKRLLFLLLSLAAAAPSSKAADDGALSLAPAAVSLRGELGQSTVQTLTLTNGTSRTFSFDLVAKDVVVENGVRTFADAGRLPGSIAATAVFSTPRVEVPPGGSVSVNARFTLPRDTQIRAVVALFRGTNQVMSGHVPMTASLGTLLAFTVSDQVEMSATDLSVRSQTRGENLAISHACTNAGSEPLTANGMLVVLDANGELVGKTAIPSRRLLPGEISPFGAEYPGELEPGRYRLLMTYDYEGRSLHRSAVVEIR